MRTTDDRPRSGQSRRIVVAMDSFKGTIAAADACQAFATGWRSAHPGDVVVESPMADGGEGTMAALAAAHLHAGWQEASATAPDGRPVIAPWLLLSDGTAVVEVAASSGLPLTPFPQPMRATSVGVGDVLRAALAHPRTRRVVIALGGSATTDGGAGALVALGARLLDADGAEVPPEPGGLLRVATVDVTEMIPPPSGGAQLLVDVTVPLLGPTGAAHQFAPQKGATETEVLALEAALEHWARVLGADPGTPGYGAAGGLAVGLCRAWDAAIVPGAKHVAALSGLPDLLNTADVIVTGEGRFDSQSLHGKVVGHILGTAPLATAAYVVCGSRGSGVPETSNALDIVELAELAGSTRAAIKDPGRWLQAAGFQIATGAVPHDSDNQYRSVGQ